MAYDESRQRIVLYGGYYGVGWPDTWEYTSGFWINTTPASVVGGRFDHRITYDAARAVVVTYGGNGDGPCPSPCPLTFLYDGSSWIQATVSAYPYQRHSAGQTYDRDRQVVVLFGGYAGTNMADTWEWDGTDWTDASPGSGPSGRYGTAMSYDEMTRRTVLWGGETPTELNDTWEYDGAAWVQTTPIPSPPQRQDYDMVYDAARRVTMLFGGFGSVGCGGYCTSTWVYQWTSAWPDEVCDSGTDDDADGLVDCADPDCDDQLCATGTCTAGLCL